MADFASGAGEALGEGKLGRREKDKRGEAPSPEEGEGTGPASILLPYRQQ